MGWKVGHIARTKERERGVVVKLETVDGRDDPFFADVKWPDGSVTREYTRDLEDGRELDTDGREDR